MNEKFGLARADGIADGIAREAERFLGCFCDFSGVFERIRRRKGGVEVEHFLKMRGRHGEMRILVTLYLLTPSYYIYKGEGKRIGGAVEQFSDCW